MTPDRHRVASRAAVLCGLALVSWILLPAADAVSPAVTSTLPFNGSVAVGVTDPVQVWFSVPMDNTTVSWTISPLVSLTPAWSANNTLLTLDHSVPFADMTLWTVEIRGNDSDGHPLVPGPVPNPWSFSTSCAPCRIVSTDPADGQANVPLDASITVVFSNPPIAGSTTWTIAPQVDLTPVWLDPATLRLSHATAFRECAAYTVEIFALDLLPGPVPNPWNFTTASTGTCITLTDPPDGAIGVSPSQVVVTFSAPVDHITVPTDLNVTPNAVPYSSIWSIPATTLTSSFFGVLPDCTLWVLSVTDPAGPVPSLVPNPWSFRTACPGPFVARTEPANGTENVSRDTAVTVTFSDPMDPAAVTWSLSPAVPVTSAWPTTSVLRLTPDARLADCAWYTVQVNATTPLFAGAIPNPWSFQTWCPPGSLRPSPPLNLTASPGNARVVLTWSPPAWDGGSPITGYRVYRGTLPGAETARADVGLGLTYADTAVVNGGTYYYQVAAMNAVALGLRAPEVSATPVNRPPSCAILAPAAGASVLGTIAITGTASDPDGSVVRVEVRIDGGVWQTATGNASWSLEWDTSSAPNGAHAITARAYDGTSYSLAPDVVTVTVGNPAPGGPTAIPVWAWAGPLIVAAIGVSVFFLGALWKRRKRRDDGEETGPGPPPPPPPP